MTHEISGPVQTCRGLRGSSEEVTMADPGGQERIPRETEGGEQGEGGVDGKRSENEL